MNDGKNEISVTHDKGFIPIDLIDRTGFVPKKGVGSLGGNLSEYITGINCYENAEAMSARLKWDHQRLKMKYGLPSQLEKYENSKEYIEKLKKIAEEKGIEIHGPQEYFDRYQEELKEGSTNEGDGKIYIREDKNDLVTAFRIEHEMVHSIQVKNGDIKNGRPIEEMEYEAYVVANLNLKNLDEDPMGTFDHIFALGLVASCRNWYKKRGESGIWDKSNEKINNVSTAGIELDDWWVDNDLWKEQVEVVEAEGGNLGDIALRYCEKFLSENSDRYTSRFKSKYGFDFNPEKFGSYQPNGAWGGGYVEQRYLMAAKGISGVDDLLPLAEAIKAGYGSSPEINEMIEAKDLDQCREILKRINPGVGIIMVEEVDPDDPDTIAWMGAGDIEIKMGLPFDRIHPIVVHEASHIESKVKLNSISVPPEAPFDEFDDMMRQTRMISTEDVARINEIRACLKWFTETGDGYFLGKMIDAAKFYDWHCFGRVGGKMSNE